MSKQTTTKNLDKSRSAGQKKTPKKNAGNSQSRMGSIVKAPVSSARGTTVGEAKILVNKQGVVTISNREFLGTIADQGTGFQLIKRLRCNPASALGFPWLYGLAINFETYRFKKLKYFYLPRCATSNQGSVMLLPDYDAADSTPLTETTASQHMNCKEDVIWKEVHCPLDPKRLNALYKQHVCMSDGRFSSTKQDQKTIDAAQFYFFVESSTTGTDGKLWVEYECELMTPQPQEIPVVQGGAGVLDNDVVKNVTNVFNSNSVAVNLQEAVPILKLLPASSFPGPNLFQFTRDWAGFITRQVTGTGMNAGTIGKPTQNGVSFGSIPGFTETIAPGNTGADTRNIGQWWGNWKEGDLLGHELINPTTLTNLVFNLGASSVV
jgi:hypothetical protein